MKKKIFSLLVLLPYVTDQLLPAHRLLALALCVRCGSLSRKRA